jgi:polyhydroxybutyrate depolymerase
MTRANRSLRTGVAASVFVRLALALVASCDSVPAPTVPTDAQLLLERPYDLRLPKAQQGPAPLLLALHGQCSSPGALDDFLQLSTAASAAGFILVFPYGSVTESGCAFWNASANGLWPYDESYLAAVIADVKQRQDVDPHQVVVLGNSLGAFMAQRMGCAHAEVVTAVVSLAGLVSLAPGVCAPTQPVGYLGAHGDADSVITYDGSPFLGDPPKQTAPSAHDTANLWATHNGCAGAVARTGQTFDFVPGLPGAETFVEAAPACPPSGAAELWTLHGADHGPDVTAEFAVQVLAWAKAHPRK